MGRSNQDDMQGPAPQLRDGAVIASLATLLAYGAIFLLRGGLEGTMAQYAGMVGLVLLPIWLSAWAVGRFGTSDLNAGLALLISLFAGIMFPLLGLVAGTAALWGALALLLFVLGASVLRLRIGGKLWGIAVMAVVSAGLTVMLGGAIRLFMPEALTLGVATSDAYWHTAIMQMIGRHWVPSIGGDGLYYQHYHYLFHMLTAGTAAMTGTGIPLVFGLWTALALKIHLVWCLVCAGALLFRAEGLDAAAWRFAYAWVAAILAYGFETESYVLGILLFAAWLPLMLLVLRGGDRRDSRTVLSIALLCLGIFFIALGKASVGYFGVIALFLLLWNYRARPILAALIAATIVGLAAFAELVLIPKELILTDSGALILVGSYMMYFARGVGLHYFLPALLVVLYLFRPRAALSRTDGGAVSLKLDAAPVQYVDRHLPGWIARGKGIAAPLRYFARADVNAQLLFLMLLGLLFVLFTMPIGDNVWDFSAPMCAIALLMLPAALGDTVGVMLTNRLIKWMMAFALALFCTQAAVQFTFNPAESLVGAITELYRSFSDDAKFGESVGARRGIRQSLAQTGKPFTDLQSRIDGFAVSRFQRDLAQKARAADGHIAVQIAPQAYEVWHFFARTSPQKWCMFPHLLTPATTGIYELRSAPPRAIQVQCGADGMVWYGFGKYQDQHRTADFSKGQLCAMATPLGVSKIYRLISYSDLSKNSLVSCND